MKLMSCVPRRNTQRETDSLFLGGGGKGRRKLKARKKWVFVCVFPPPPIFSLQNKQA